MRWNLPQALARSDLHDSPACVDELIRAVRMFSDMRSAWILTSVRRNRHARLRVILPDKDLSHNRYIMSEHVSCDKA